MYKRTSTILILMHLHELIPCLIHRIECERCSRTGVGEGMTMYFNLFITNCDAH